VKEVANKLFAHKVDIKLKKQEVVFDTVICSFDLTFDNGAFKDWQVLILLSLLNPQTRHG
jgi:hypothetical protein